MIALLAATNAGLYDFTRNPRHSNKDHLVLTIVGFVGGGFAGLIFANLFGRPGLKGWVYSLIGGIVTTGIGGAIAGTILVPGIGTMIGAMYVIVVVLGNELTLLWFGGFALVHLITRQFSRRWASYLLAPTV
ncbi:MAG: hypothetical protein ACPGRZ_04745 [Alphaproteobacteria bacterium]